jgi:signal peptidase I
METKTQFIFRREEPFKKKIGDRWDNEDINTLGSNMVFEGFITDVFNGAPVVDDILFPSYSNNVISHFFSEILLNYDVVRNIDSYCYIRTIEIRPGSYQESWREPTDNEMYQFINILKDVYRNQGDVNYIKDDRIYKWFLKKERDNKIDSIIDLN